MQVGMRPPIAPKPQSIILPMPRHATDRRSVADMQSATHETGGAAPVAQPRLRKTDIPPPPCSPPPPLPAPRVASLKQGAKLLVYPRTEADGEFEYAEPYALSVCQAPAANHYGCAVIVEAPEQVAPAAPPNKRQAADRQPTAAAPDGYVSFIQPNAGTGTLKRRLCRTASRARRVNSPAPIAADTMQSPNNGQHNGRPQPNANVASEAHVDETVCSTINSVVQPHIVAPQTSMSEARAKVAAVLGSLASAEKSSSRSAAAQTNAFPISTLAAEPRARSMSTSTWRRTQPGTQAPQSGSMSMRVRSAVQNTVAEEHVVAVWEQERLRASSQAGNADTIIYEDVPSIKPYPGPAEAEEESGRRNVNQSPLIGLSADSEYEPISPCGTLGGRLSARCQGPRPESVYSAISDVSTVSASTCDGQEAGELLSAWEDYLRGANQCEAENCVSDSDAEDESELVDFSSSDEGAATEEATQLVIPKPVPKVRRAQSQAQRKSEDEDPCKLVRTNAIRRGPRTSARGEDLRALMPSELSPSIPSLLSDSSKESLSEEVTTTERLCDDCRYWKKMEFRQLDMNAAVCSQCQAHRRKRTRTISEVLATEEKYGQNLNVIKEVFMEPMLNGLVPTEHCEKIFVNLEELIDLNKQLCQSLEDQVAEVTRRSSWEDAGHRATIGKVFMEHMASMKAFEVYCVSQANSARALNLAIKKSNLFKLFLQVCQNDDQRCSNMPLPAFLIAPLQRVTRYPLLLAKILSHTPQRHPDHASLSDCMKHLEVMLDKINSESVIPGQGNKLSVQTKPSAAKEILSKKTADELLEFALSKVGWARDQAELIYHGPLEVQSQQRSSRRNSASAPKSSMKSIVTHAVLVQLKDPIPHDQENRQFVGRFSLCDKSGSSKPHLVLIGVNKTGDMICQKEPVSLDRCIVAAPATAFEGSGSCFDVTTMTDHSSVILKAPGPHSRDQWMDRLSLATKKAGLWRQRRRGLPNIMIFDNNRQAANGS